MFRALRHHRTLLPPTWIRGVLQQAVFVVAGAALLTIGAVWWTATHFRINTDLTAMVDDDLPFRKFKRSFDVAFPAWAKSIVVVIDAPTPEQAEGARRRLVEALERRTDALRAVYAPGGGPFFARNGLLYQDLEALEALTDRMAEFQPFLGLITENPTLSNVFDVLAEVLEEMETGAERTERLDLLFERLAGALEAARAGAPIRFSWRELLDDEPLTPADRRRFVVATPRLDFSHLLPARSAVDALEEEIAGLPVAESDHVRFRLTGDVMISQADLRSVREGIGLSAVVSLLLVSAALYTGLRSLRLVLASLVTLIAGLAWTTALALLLFKQLNMISIAFAVLFIGIGIDYSIQFCLRYQDHAARGYAPRDSIRRAARGVSNALLLCTLTTAIGFLSFVPTAYQGASQLGLISAVGMGVNFIAHLTLLPALLSLMPGGQATRPPSLAPPAWQGWGRTGDRLLVAAAAAAGLGGLLLLPRMTFDFNPLNMSDPSAEAVSTAQELFADPRTSPWTLSALAESETEAARLSERLKALPEVDSVVWLDHYVPERQEDKRGLIEDLALFLPAGAGDLEWTQTPPEAAAAAMGRLGAAVADAAGRESPGSRFQPILRELEEELDRTAALLRESPRAGTVVHDLEAALLGRLADLLGDLTRLTEAAPFDAGDLPPAIRERYLGDDGRYLVQVFPADNIRHNESLLEFVAAVQAVTPHITSAPVVMSRSGEVIFDAFRRATVLAVLLIGAALFVVFRRVVEVVQILLPLALAFVLAGASTVLLRLPLNFANIIVLPLLLGIGVDYGIHMMYRFHEEHESMVNLLHTSTARGVFFSAVTTIVSFGSLILVSHRGTASMGLLLTLGMAVILVCTLLVLPAVLQFRYGPRGGRRRAARGGVR